MRGIRFYIRKEYGKYLWEILKPIDFLKYTWYVDQDEILFFNKKEGKVFNNFFTRDIFTGEEFKKCITKDNYFICSVNIQAYPIDDPKDNILSYDDFKKSKCEILLLCVDSKYVELYSKNDIFIKRLFHMCMQNEYQNVEYITDENDDRAELRL